MDNVLTSYFRNEAETWATGSPMGQKSNLIQLEEFLAKHGNATTKTNQRLLQSSVGQQILRAAGKVMGPPLRNQWIGKAQICPETQALCQVYFAVADFYYFYHLLRCIWQSKEELSTLLEANSEALQNIANLLVCKSSCMVHYTA